MRGSPVVDAKISMPPPNRWAPDRAAARAKLDRGHRVGVTVVEAGPGYLKRQLVESWGRLDPRRRIAWVSLDEADDPERLLVHSLAAVQVVLPDFARDFDPEDLVGPGDWHVRAADGAVHALGELTEPLVLVFDGVHRLVDPQSRRGLETLIRYRPEVLRIVVITRDDAALDLSSATMAGSVVELREADLALDVDQSYRMLAQDDAATSMEDATALHAATGGWPAGVALASSRRTPHGSILPFAPDEEPVLSYLRNRVLDSLDDDLASFFLEVAPLRFVHPDLAAHVTGRKDAGRALDRLAELHLLSEDPGGRPGWRRFPAHLERFARHESRARDERASRDLCRRAARWCWERELLDESLTVASCADDSGLLAEILLEHHYAWTAGGEADRVRHWCGVLLQDDPGLVEAQLAAAWALLYLSDDTAASSAVALLDTERATGDRKLFIEGELDILRSHLARRRGHMEVSLELARRGAAAAARLGPEFETHYRGALPAATGLHVGLAAIWAGQLDEAVSHLDAARAEEGWAQQAYPAIHGHLALAHWLRGDPSALAHATTALMHVQVHSLGGGDFTALCMALILAVEGAGSETLAQVKALAGSLDEPGATVLAACAEAVFLASTNPSGARDAVRRGRIASDSCPEPGLLTTMVATVAAEVGVDRDPVFGDPLTEGEMRVLRMLCGPLTEREIAAELHLSHNTVRTYRRRLYRKLGLKSRDDVERAVEALRPIPEG